MSHGWVIKATKILTGNLLYIMIIGPRLLFSKESSCLLQINVRTTKVPTLDNIWSHNSICKWYNCNFKDSWLPVRTKKILFSVWDIFLWEILQHEISWDLRVFFFHSSEDVLRILYMPRNALLNYDILGLDEVSLNELTIVENNLETGMNWLCIVFSTMKEKEYTNSNFLKMPGKSYNLY